ncbi:MAG: hypothetical protein AAF916_05200 [Planctomycetota bacterium]
MRIPATLRLGLLVVLSWFVMTLTHELGHVLFGWLSGARLVELKLFGLPHSFYEPNPWPMWTLWGGPVVGVAGPVLAALLLGLALKRGGAVSVGVWFVADFCVLANGMYLALAWKSGNETLDTARLLEAGVHPAWIVIFCVFTIGAGYVRFRRDVAEVLGRAKVDTADDDPQEPDA